jgi:hypothetical protein
MTPERRKCAVIRSTAETSIARQRLVGHVSAATDRLVETETLLRNQHTFPQKTMGRRIIEELFHMVISIRFVPKL